jgi:hypothetical protein
MPTVYNVGTVASGVGAVNPALPAGTQPGDVLVLFIENEDASPVGAVTGYTEITSAFVPSGSLTRLSVRWKRAGTGEVAPTVPDPGDHVVARIVGLRGCVEQGNPWIVAASTTELVSDTSASIPAGVTQFGDCLVLAAVSTGTDVASTTHISAFANGSLTSVTERIDNWVADGLGGGIGVASGNRALAGNYGATTATLVTAQFKALVSVAFRGAGKRATPHRRLAPGRISPTGAFRPSRPGFLPPPNYPPTFVGEYESAWDNTTTPKTISVTVQTGDVLVISGVTADSVKTLNTPTGGSHSYTLRQSSAVASNTGVYLWTAVAVADETFTLSVAAVGAGAQFWGFNCLQYRNSDGVGASNKATSFGAPNMTLTTTQSNSAVVAVNGDWSAADGTTRTWRTVNAITPAIGSGEQSYFRDDTQYAVYVAYWSDVGSAGLGTYGLSAPTGQVFSLCAVEVYGSSTPPAGGPLQGNLGLATETGTAQTLTRQKLKALGQVAETDTAQAMTRVHSRTLGLVTETDTPQSIGRVKRKTLGLVTETNTAQIVRPAHARTLGQASETDTTFSLARRKQRTLGQAVESDTAQTTTRRKSKGIGQMSETDTALGVQEVRSRTLGQASETDTAQSTGRRKSRTLGQAAETDTVQPIARQKRKTLGLVTETDTAFSITEGGGSSVVLNQAAETDTAQPMGRRKLKTLGQVSETDTAQAITRQKRKTLGLVTETDVVLGMARRKSRTLGLLTETSTVFAIARVERKALNQVTEVSTAFALTRRHSKVLGLVSSSESAFGFARRKLVNLGLAEELNQAIPVGGGAVEKPPADIVVIVPDSSLTVLPPDTIEVKVVGTSSSIGDEGVIIVRGT